MKFELVFIIALASGVFSQPSQRCLNCLDRDIDPVCGLDGITYINRCQLRRCANTQVGYEGPCKCNCRAESVNPVCASDGMTYRNRCAAECAKATVQYVGACNAQSLPGSGGCDCIRNFELVCGVDGRTYESRCDAQCLGVAVSYRHPCYT